MTNLTIPILNGIIPNGIIPNGIIPNGIIPNGIIPNGIVPYSAEAVANLVALERKHRLSIKGARRECDNCMINKHGKPVTEKDIIRWSGADYPCPTLTSARSISSEETLVAVALILG